MTIVDFASQGTIGTTYLPKRYDISIYQGDTFKFDLVLKDTNGVALDITGWTGLAQIKKVSDSSAAETPTISVAVGTTDGKITASISNTGTSALQEATEYKYDIQLTDLAGNVRTFIGGVITITEDVSE